MDLCERTSSPKFVHPSNIAIYGNTGTGKTHFLKLLLSNPDEYFLTRDGKKIEKIVYCYGSVRQPIFSEMQEMGIIMIKVYRKTLNRYLEKINLLPS